MVCWKWSRPEPVIARSTGANLRRWQSRDAPGALSNFCNGLGADYFDRMNTAKLKRYHLRASRSARVRRHPRTTRMSF
jgi:hypothetical protein